MVAAVQYTRSEGSQHQYQQDNRRFNIIPDDNYTVESTGNVSVNTLAAFLIDSASQSRTNNNDASFHRRKQLMTPNSISLEVLRKRQIEKQAITNALNQFILQAGNIYKGKRLSELEANRLRDAASHVGLSMEVVDALLEQTANPNAVVEYCMTSGDTFAQKIKNDPQLSRMLQNGRFHTGRDGLNLAKSIWRVFMHKIIQQFLREQNMQLEDVMDKSSLTGRLYEEAFKDEPNDYENCENNFNRANIVLTSIPRNYTEERKKVCIPESVAKQARIEAEARIQFHPRVPFEDLMSRNSIDMIPRSDFVPQSGDDDLSLQPCAAERDHKASVEELKRRRKSIPADFIQLADKADSSEKVSAVKRGLAFFEKSLKNNTPIKDVKRRNSEGTIRRSTVLKAKAVFEKGHQLPISSSEQTRSKVSTSPRKYLHDITLPQTSTSSTERSATTESSKADERITKFVKDPLTLNRPTYNSKTTAEYQLMEKEKDCGASRICSSASTNSREIGSVEASQSIKEEVSRLEFSQLAFSSQEDCDDQLTRMNTLMKSYEQRIHDESESADVPHDKDYSPLFGQRKTALNKRLRDDVISLSASAFSKTGLVCVDQNQDNYGVKEIYSGLTQSSDSCADNEVIHIPPCKGCSKTLSAQGSRNTNDMQSLQTSRRSFRDETKFKTKPKDNLNTIDSGLSWTQFSSSYMNHSTGCDADRIEISRNDTSSLPYNEQVQNTNSGDDVPPQSRQLEWTNTFGNRNNNVEGSKPSSDSGIIKAHSLPKNYIHTFPTSPTVVTNATSSFTQRHSGQSLSAESSSWVSFQPTRNRVSLERNGNWTKFDGTTFESPADLYSHEGYIEGVSNFDFENMEIKAHMSNSSDGNTSCQNKPRKYFQKLLSNEIPASLSNFESYSNSSSFQASCTTNRNRSLRDREKAQDKQSQTQLNWSQNYDSTFFEKPSWVPQQQRHATHPNQDESWEAFSNNMYADDRTNDDLRKLSNVRKYNGSEVKPRNNDARHIEVFLREGDAHKEHQSYALQDNHGLNQHSKAGQANFLGSTIESTISSSNQFLNEINRKEIHPWHQVKNNYNDTSKKQAFVRQWDSEKGIAANEAGGPSLKAKTSEFHQDHHPYLVGYLEENFGSNISTKTNEKNISQTCIDEYLDVNRTSPSQPSREMSIGIDNNDMAAIFEYRQRRESIEPHMPTKRGNVEMKKNLLEENHSNNNFTKNVQRQQPALAKATLGTSFSDLDAFLEEYEYEQKNNARPIMPPPTPLGLNRSGRGDHFSNTEDSLERRQFLDETKGRCNDIEETEMSSSLSHMLQVETVTSDENDEDDDDVGLNSPHHVDWPRKSAAPTGRKPRSLSPTAFRSNESSEMDVDEEEIRAAARQNGIPSPVVEIIHSQSKEHNHQDSRMAQYAKYDSDTGRPASTRHLYSGPYQSLGFNTGRTWDTVEEEKSEWPISSTNQLVSKSPCATDVSAHQARHYAGRDPSPKKGLSTADATSIHELTSTEVPEGATNEELKLLNRFIEVASGNFGGNKLSVESESRVRLAAQKVGLTPKFVDQILRQQDNDQNSSKNLKAPFTFDTQSKQANHHEAAYYEASQQGKLEGSQLPYATYEGENFGGEASTYYTVDYTRTTKQTKKTEATEPGCNVWETISKNVGYALAKTCGTTKASTEGGRDDGSSISSATSWDDNVTNAGSSSFKKQRRNSTGRRRSGARQRAGGERHQGIAEEATPQIPNMAVAVEADAKTPSAHNVRALV